MSEAISNAVDARLQKLEQRSAVEEKTSSLEKRITKLESTLLAAKWASIIVITFAAGLAGIATWVGNKLSDSADNARIAANEIKEQNKALIETSQRASAEVANLRTQNADLVTQLRNAQQTYALMTEQAKQDLRNTAGNVNAENIERIILARGIATRADFELIRRDVVSLQSSLNSATRIIFVSRPGNCPDGFRPISSNNNTVLIGYSRAERSSFERIWQSAGNDGGSIQIGTEGWIGTHPHICIRN